MYAAFAEDSYLFFCCLSLVVLRFLMTSHYETIAVDKRTGLPKQAANTIIGVNYDNK